MYSIKPYISYFVRSNHAVGLKFDYTRGVADLGRRQWTSTATSTSPSAT